MLVGWWGSGVFSGDLPWSPISRSCDEKKHDNYLETSSLSMPLLVRHS